LAFITSVAGISTALVTSLFPRVYFIKKEEVDENLSDTELLRAIHGELTKLNNNISGDNDSTLITQIQKMRTSIVDKQDELKNAFDEFATQMAKNNIEQLIEAINKVMEDFNAKINDQLGQSFKELSDSVRSLVEWQQNYITTVQEATGALGAAQESLKNSSDSLTNTSDKVSEIAENNKNISEVNQELKVVVENLNQMLGSTVGFSQNMKVLAESLSGSGDTIRTEIKSLVEESILNMQTHAEDISRNINAISDTAMKNMQEKNTETLQNFEEINQKTLQDFGGHLASIAGKMTDDFRRVQEALSIK
jgi:DNA anti-recombination protein RmuC